MKKREPKHMKRKCKVSVKESGLNYCSTHDVYWGDDGPCPKEES